jgi:tetratricopeptide (TPR) repeat protein
VHSIEFVSFSLSNRIQQESLGPNHLDVVMSHNNMGLVYQEMGEYKKAISSHEKAVEIYKSLSPNHSGLGMSYNNIGLVYYNMGQYSKALSFYRRAVEIGQQSLPSNHPHLQLYRENLERAKKK